MATSKLDDMGVSRSGRIRKKSSKLLDYESSDEMEVRPRKANQGTPKGRSKKSESQETPTVPPLQIRLSKQGGQAAYKTSYDCSQSSEESEDHINFTDKLDFSAYDDSNSHTDDLNGHQDEFDNDDFDRTALEIDKNPLFQDSGEVEEEEESDNNIEPEMPSDSDGDGEIPGGPAGSDHSHPHSGSKQPSLYLLENARKKMVMKDGRIVAAKQKAQRKDKGKTRFTAYMLWSKEMRPIVSSQHPDLKFEGVSKRLGELWSTVSPAEKMTWKRRAMRMATKASGGMISTGAQSHGARVKTTVSPKKATTARSAPKTASPHKQHAVPQEDKSSIENDSSLSQAVLQPRSHELEPLDVATHLHLLGESLSLIGARLKERDGQIAVSGSLSVLLDSMLCALGPLLCLTRLTPETNAVAPETLSRILDNIAYIMPGL